MSDRLIAFDAGALRTPFEHFAPGRVIVKGGRIEACGHDSDVAAPEEAQRIELPGLTLVPGFIDPHIHGCAGIDLMEATPQSMNTVSRALARHGTTAFLPTTVSAPPSTLTAVVERLGNLIGKPFDGALPLGIHLEGPFISAQKRGTHRPENIHPPDASLLQAWIRQSNGKLKLLTMAPELDGAAAVAALAQSAGVVAAMGHSWATFDEAAAAAGKGVCYAVHTFNAMREMTHREPGIAGAVLADDRIFAEILADGVHVHPEMIRIFARAKGPRRIILATDAISAAGMPDGHYALGVDVVQVTGGVCRDTEGRLAGSTLTQDQALRNFIRWSGLTLGDALGGVTANPAEALNLPGRGRIEPGARADFTILDADLNVVKTFVEGKLVFER